MTKKWLGVFSVNLMRAEIVVNKFSEVIALFVIPNTITIDGVKWFMGFEFQTL